MLAIMKPSTYVYMYIYTWHMCYICVYVYICMYMHIYEESSKSSWKVHNRIQLYMDFNFFSPQETHTKLLKVAEQDLVSGTKND